MPVKELYVMFKNLQLDLIPVLYTYWTYQMLFWSKGVDWTFLLQSKHIPKTKLFNKLLIVLNPIVACVNVFWF